MANTRVSMRQTKEILRLHHQAGRSGREIARTLSVSPATVQECLRRARGAGLDWATIGTLDEAQLENRLFPAARVQRSQPRTLPDFAAVHTQLKRKGVTLALLWEEYKAVTPDGLQYSQFCERYRQHGARVDLVMRQHHRAGEKLFVDYAGQTVAVTDRDSGEIKQAQVFVAVLGASSYTYVEATWTQTLPDFIGAHVRALNHFGSAPEIIVPDNLKSAVTRTDRYEPGLNRTYQDFAAHYALAIIPARPRKPRDKAKVEAGVLLVERWILARLRHHTFFSLHELNAAISTLRDALNRRPFRKLAGSRQEWFEQLDRPAMRPLPTTAYEYGEWLRTRVHIDYHVEADKHYYSVPYLLVGEDLDTRLTAHTVEVFHRGQRVASHLRSPLRGRHTTLTLHMPKAHQHYAAWTPQRLVQWAHKSGPATAKLVEMILTTRKHPQQGFRACLGIMRLGKQYDAARLEAACRRALTLGAYSYKSVESILRRGLDSTVLPTAAQSTAAITHDNLRGAEYFH